MKIIFFAVFVASIAAVLQAESCANASRKRSGQIHNAERQTIPRQSSEQPFNTQPLATIPPNIFQSTLFQPYFGGEPTVTGPTSETQNFKSVMASAKSHAEDPIDHTLRKIIKTALELEKKRPIVEPRVDMVRKLVDEAIKNGQLKMKDDYILKTKVKRILYELTNE